jgi:hypothetical protein
MAQTIAEERLVGLRPSGEWVEVVAAIGLPYQVGQVEWACPVSLAGLHDGLHDIHGVSSLQALCLAASLLRQLLTAFVEGGGRLLYADGKTPFSIPACFSGVGLRARDGSV